MTALDLVLAVSLFGFVVMWLLYTIEAFRQATIQGVLTLVVPLYLFHFAFIRSVKGSPYRLVLLAMCAIYALATIWRTQALAHTG